MKKQLLILSLVIGMILTFNTATYAKTTINTDNQIDSVNLQSGLPAPGYIKGVNVPFKSSANTSYTTLDVFEFGEEIVVNYFTGNWASVYRIETGQYGYVSKRFISFGAV